jgi:hypothetical protein
MLFGFVALPVSAAPPPASSSGGTSGAINGACQADPNSVLCKDSQNATTKVTTFSKTLVNVLLYILGGVSVIVIIISGFFYATSSGDSNLITKAKNTLIYAVVGLVVAIMSYAIVNFVLVNLK